MLNRLLAFAAGFALATLAEASLRVLHAHAPIESPANRGNQTRSLDGAQRTVLAMLVASGASKAPCQGDLNAAAPAAGSL